MANRTNITVESITIQVLLNIKNDILQIGHRTSHKLRIEEEYRLKNINEKKYRSDIFQVYFN